MEHKLRARTRLFMKNGERIFLLKIISFSLNCLSDIRQFQQHKYLHTFTIKKKYENKLVISTENGNANTTDGGIS